MRVTPGRMTSAQGKHAQQAVQRRRHAMTAGITGSSHNGDRCCEPSRDQLAEYAPGRPEMQRIELSLSGLRDTNAASKLATHFRQLAGVRSAMANPISSRLLVEFNPTEKSVEDVVRSAEVQEPDVGRAMARWHIRMPEFDCDRCARLVEEDVKAVAGVEGVTWNAAVRCLTVEYTPRRLVAAAVRAALVTRHPHGSECR